MVLIRSPSHVMLRLNWNLMFIFRLRFVFTICCILEIFKPVFKFNITFLQIYIRTLNLNFSEAFFSIANKMFWYNLSSNILKVSRFCIFQKYFSSMLINCFRDVFWILLISGIFHFFKDLGRAAIFPSGNKCPFCPFTGHATEMFKK